MAEIRIPYGRTVWNIEIPDNNLIAVLESRVNDFKPQESQQDIVYEALNNPIQSPPLQDLVKGKKSAVIITSDHTRPVPSKITMPILLDTLRKTESRINIKILVSTGYHRETNQEELIEKFGKEIVTNEKIIIHDSRNSESMIPLGNLPSGGELWLNKTAIETDLLIAEGFIEPHFFAGFSGGRKSVLPGIAGYQTVLANHCAEFISSDYSRTGILEKNPIHIDMMHAAEKANLAFILNVVLNDKKEIIAAFSGDHEKAHLEGCEFLTHLARVDRIESDIVITSNGGYPLDQNIYQSVKGMTAAEATCREGGVIIMVSACNDGHGGESFFKNMANARSPGEVLERVIQIPRNETLPDQWEFQILARILKKHIVILVTDQCDPELVKAMHMEHTFTFDEALKMALDLKGRNAKITVIPDGVSVIVGEN